MAKTKYITVTGPVKWAFHIFKEGMDTKYGEKFTLQMYPDAKSKLVLKEAGYRGKWHEDGDGDWTKFSRDNKKTFADRVEEFGPPKVMDGEGKEWDSSVTIGNGSVCSAQLEVFPSKFGVGSRLIEVRVLKHVPYEKQDTENGPPVV